MEFVALETVLDEETATLLAEALEERDVPVEIHRLGVNAYLGAATPASFEVRVPGDWLAAARETLAAFAASSSNLDPDEGHVPAGELPPEPYRADARDATWPRSTAAPAPQASPPKLWIAVGTGLLLPLPFGCIYARFAKLGWLLLALGATGAIGGLATGRPIGIYLAIAVKLIDFTLAPVLVAVTNRRMSMSGGAGLRRGATLSILFGTLAIVASLLAWRSVEAQRLGKEAMPVFLRAAKQMNATAALGEEPPATLPALPDVPVGRMMKEVLVHKREGILATRRAFAIYFEEQREWRQNPFAVPNTDWRRERGRRAGELRAAIDDYSRSESTLAEKLLRQSKQDSDALAFYEAMRDVQSSDAALRNDDLISKAREIAGVWQQLSVVEYDGSAPLLKRAEELAKEIDEALRPKK